MPAALAGLATLLFCGVLAIFPALAGALFVRLAAPGYWPRALLFAALWTLTEWLARLGVHRLSRGCPPATRKRRRARSPAMCRCSASMARRWLRRCSAR
jgi:hypothetical protein